MSTATSHALSIARPVIRALLALNVLYGLGVICILAYSLVIPGWPENPFGKMMIERFPYAPGGLRAIVVIGIVGAAIVHTVLRRLVAIVDTVRAGDPFTIENSRRLEIIAWSVMALEVLRLAVVSIVAAVFIPGRFGGIALSPWLAVLLLFVLAGVFKQGARMRADLEGTI
jgi:hypothetical protein